MSDRTDRAIASALVDAATALAEDGELVAAVRMYQRALTLLGNTIDGDDALVSTTRIRCSSLLADLGRDAEAAAMLR